MKTGFFKSLWTFWKSTPTFSKSGYVEYPPTPTSETDSLSTGFTLTQSTLSTLRSIIGTAGTADLASIRDFVAFPIIRESVATADTLGTIRMVAASEHWDGCTTT